MTFGERLRKARKARGWPLKFVAQKAGISLPYLSKVERGDFLPPAEAKVRAIARVLGLDPARMVGLANREKVTRKWVSPQVEARVSHRQGESAATALPLRASHPPFGREELWDVVALRRPGDEPSAWGRAFETLVTVVREGLRHGTFDYSLLCDLGPERERNFTIRAGRVWEFCIPASEVEQGANE